MNNHNTIVSHAPVRTGRLFLYESPVRKFGKIIAVASLVSQEGETLRESVVRLDTTEAFNTSVQCINDLLKNKNELCVDHIALMPHARPFYINGKECPCPICIIARMDGAIGGISAETATATRDDLPEFEAVVNACDRLVATERDNYQNFTLVDRVKCRIRRIFDSEGKIVGRVIANKFESTDVWTDASVSGSTVGVAAIGEHIQPVVETITKTTFRASTKVLFGELRAIRHGIEQAARVANKINVHTDSLHACERINEARLDSFDPNVKDELLKINRLVTAFEQLGGSVSVQWVKAHDGEPLNEAADRLAKLARRAQDWKMDDELIQQQINTINSDVQQNIA